MTERRKSGLESSACIFSRTRYFTLKLRVDHFVAENKQKKHRLAAGFFEAAKINRIIVYRAMKTGLIIRARWKIQRGDSTDKCIVSNSRHNWDKAKHSLEEKVKILCYTHITWLSRVLNTTSVFKQMFVMRICKTFPCQFITRRWMNIFQFRRFN